jgi:hypothetical protein
MSKSHRSEHQQPAPVRQTDSGQRQPTTVVPTPVSVPTTAPSTDQGSVFGQVAREAQNNSTVQPTVVSPNDANSLNSFNLANLRPSAATAFVGMTPGPSVRYSNSRNMPDANSPTNADRQLMRLSVQRDPFMTNSYTVDLTPLMNQLQPNQIKSKADLENFLQSNGINLQSSGMNINSVAMQYDANNRPFLRINTSDREYTRVDASASLSYRVSGQNDRRSEGRVMGFLRYEFGGSGPNRLNYGIEGSYRNGNAEVSTRLSATPGQRTTPRLDGVFVAVPRNMLRTDLNNNLPTGNTVNQENNRTAAPQPKR